jgi:hypothetical protein
LYDHIAGELVRKDLTQAVLRAGVPIWQAAAGEYADHLRPIVNAAAELREALFSEQGFLSQVRRQAGGGGNRPIIECLTGIIFQLDKTIDIGKKRQEEAERIAAKK